MMTTMTPNMPYLLRAFYEWIVDNDLTPHLVVDTTIQGTVVPMEHSKDGQIVLNISPSACQNLLIGNVDITFDARFGGVARNLIVPCVAVQAIYARENGAGTMFTHDEMPQDDSIESSNEPKTESVQSTSDKPNDATKPKKGSHLKVVK